MFSGHLAFLVIPFSDSLPHATSICRFSLCSIGGVCISESFLYTTYLFSASCPPYPDLSPLEDSTIQCNPLLSLLYFVTIGIG